MPLTQADASDLFRRPPESFVDVGHGEVAYRRVGSGPDVVFSHGWPVSGATFRGLLPYLVDHVTCHVIDYVSAGSSRFSDASAVSIQGHIDALRTTIDQLDLDDVAVVGHDSGGMIARHALAGDDRLRSMGLINTEPSVGISWRFRMFLANRRVPGFGRALGWLAGKPAIRRNKFVLGDAFTDRSLLDGEFDEFFLRPLHEDRARQTTAVRLLKSFDLRFLHELGDVHARIAAPVQLVWGVDDPFFPIEAARRDVATFPDAQIAEIEDAGLFCHEEKPAEVAAALLPVLIGER
ncbi:MAG: alpha/beta hydrolase [Actinomycetota bacterium]